MIRISLNLCLKNSSPMDLLFSKKSLSSLLDVYRKQLRQDIDDWSETMLLSSSEAQLIDRLVDKFTLEVPKLYPRDDWRVDKQDIRIDVSHNAQRFLRVDGTPITMPGQRISLYIPFTGDADLFEFQPSTFDLNPPRASVDDRGNVISYTREVPQKSEEAKQFKHEIDMFVKKIDKYLCRMRQDCEHWNVSLRNTAIAQIRERKRRLAEQADFLAELDIPLKGRSDSDETVSIPVTPIPRPTARRPPVPKKQHCPDPIIAEDDYIGILEIISRLSITIERSPTTFAGMSESHIREHILVSLNGFFKGSATGETFNALGKTDILIREQNQNLFVGECKFWKGPKELLKAIDQLLNYVTWRDTKTALIVFVKQQNFTAVLDKIKESVPNHANFNHGPDLVTETQFRFRFLQKNDEERCVHLSVLVFHIPIAHESNESEV